MNIVKRFEEHAAGHAMIEMTLPKDYRLLGGDPLSDWQDALKRTAARLDIEIGIREKDRGYMVAFHTHGDCERVMESMQPLWEEWLMQRLKPAAVTAYRNNPRNPEQAVSSLVEDYGYRYSDFTEHIEQVVHRAQARTEMTESYYRRLFEKMESEQLDGHLHDQENHRHQGHDFDRYDR